MKHTPTLSFHYDEGPERGVRLTQPAGRRMTGRGHAGGPGRASTRVVDEIRAGERFLLTTHENPDGDALGSLLAMHQVLRQLGKDSVMFLAAKEFPLPVEYRFLPLEEVFHEPPADVADRRDRLPRLRQHRPHARRLPARADDAHVLNIDHHHDNTRFGTVNLVDTEASCTAEIVFESAERLGAELTPGDREALYVGLVTDTGRFMYENTDAPNRTGWPPS